MIYTIEINGEMHTVFGLRDMMELIDRFMGAEFRIVLEEILAGEDDGGKL